MRKHQDNRMYLFLALVLLGGLCRSACAEAAFNQWVIRGFDALERDQAAEALTCFIEARKANPFSAVLDSYLGLGYFKSEDYVNAFEYYTRAATREATVVDSAFLFYQASTLRALGLVLAERAAWRQLAEWDPDSKFSKLAREALAEASSRRPAGTEALLGEGLRVWDASPHTAVAFFREAHQVGDDNWTEKTALYLASALNRTGQYQDVLAMQNPAGNADSSGLWQMQQVLALVGLEQWESALDRIAAIEKSDLVAAHADYLRALCQIRLGAQDDALAAIPALSPRIETELMEALVRLAQFTPGPKASKR